VVKPATDTPGLHQIGEVAEAVGLSLRTIRHYEEVGLVPPSGRTSGGFRLYTAEDIELLRLVKQMKPLDFTLEEMRDVLDTLHQARTGTDPEGVRDVLGRLAMYAAAADARCEKLRDQLAAAEGMAHMLRQEAHRKPRTRP
jgi:MerR family copper efflux transcriptional regulator